MECLLYGNIGVLPLDPITTLGSGFNPGFGSGAAFFTPLDPGVLGGIQLHYTIYDNTLTTTSQGFLNGNPHTFSTTQTINSSNLECALAAKLPFGPTGGGPAYVLAGAGVDFQSFSNANGSASLTSPFLRLGTGNYILNQPHFRLFAELDLNLIGQGTSAGSLSFPSGLVLEIPLSLGIGLN
jgi:hypothetical protein